MTKKHIDTKVAAAYLCERGFEILPTTLEHWRCTGRYRLPYTKIGRLVRYDVGDLDAFIEAHKVNPGAAA